MVVGTRYGGPLFNISPKTHQDSEIALLEVETAVGYMSARNGPENLGTRRLGRM